VSVARPTAVDRREFIRTSAASAWALLASQSIFAAQDIGAGDHLVGTVPFLTPTAQPVRFNRLLESGLDARLFTDLESLQPGALVTPNDRFFVRTAFSNPSQASATLDLGGLVDKPQTLSVKQVEAMAVPSGIHLLECAGNLDAAAFGLISAASWDGVSVSSLIDRAAPARTAPFVLVSGIDDPDGSSRTSVPGASWIFSRADLERRHAFLAVRMNGVPLPPNHGAPMRLVVPGWYGCSCIKWVNRLELVGDDAEATSQMREYASRTHQRGQPRLARDYLPAAIETAAMPIRVERWIRKGRTAYRVVGIIWGEPRPATGLLIRFKHTENWTAVDDYARAASETTWSLWSHWWTPKAPGRYEIVLKVADPSIPTRRLDIFFYVRSVEITSV
jgi:DMSO/TMAO reductase YedYZ molybdopterin-dependent catalytic subunit